MKWERKEFGSEVVLFGKMTSIGNKIKVILASPAS
jgi:hypothetical protein